jgi:hypothetical protein
MSLWLICRRLPGDEPRARQWAEYHPYSTGYVWTNSARHATFFQTYAEAETVATSIPREPHDEVTIKEQR